MKKEYTVLIIGETGVGKTTWINSIRNYVEYETFQEATSKEPKILIPARFNHTSRTGVTREVRLGEPDPNERQETGKSGTKGPRSYILERKDYIINLIDSPGIGDTELQDTANMKAILSHLNEYEELHAICILLKPDDCRLTTWFKYCIQELLLHLHKDAIRNIKFCFTRTRATNYGPGSTLPILKQLLESLHMDLLKTTYSFQRNTFYFDNEAFICLALKKNGIEVTKWEEKSFGISWDRSVEETNRLFEEITKLSGHSTARTISLNRARDVVVKISKPLALITKTMGMTLDHLHSLKEKAQKLDLEKENLTADLYFKVLDVKKTRLKGPRTTCTHESCVDTVTDERGETQIIHKQVCCEPCYLDFIGVSPETTNDIRLRFCWAMKLLCGNCNKCSHSYKYHMHTTYDYQIVEKTTLNEKNKVSLEQNKSLLELNNDILKQQDELLKELKLEHEAVISASANFAYFLKKNAILPYNDAFEEYIKFLMDQERSRGGENSIQMQRLKLLKQNYEQKCNEIERALEIAQYSKNADRLTAEKILEIEANLYNLKHYGGTIKSFMEDDGPPPQRRVPVRFFDRIWNMVPPVQGFKTLKL